MNKKLEEWFEALESEYAEMPPLPKPSRRARLRGKVIDARYRLACWMDPYDER